MTIVQVIVSGILIGGIYSLVSIGLALIWGIPGLLTRGRIVPGQSREVPQVRAKICARW